MERTDIGLFKLDPHLCLRSALRALRVGQDGRGQVLSADGGAFSYGFPVQPVSQGALGAVSDIRPGAHRGGGRGRGV